MGSSDPDECGDCRVKLIWLMIEATVVLLPVPVGAVKASARGGVADAPGT